MEAARPSMTESEKNDDTGIDTGTSARVGVAVGGGIGTSVNAGRTTLGTRASAPFV